jgi:hypothetical protein
MMASFQRNGSVMIPISVASPIKQVRPVLQISGTEKKKNMIVVRFLLLDRRNFFYLLHERSNKKIGNLEDAYNKPYG